MAVPVVSVVIPSRNELFLAPTVRDALSKASGVVEVIVALDGYWPDPPLSDDPRLILVHSGKPRGMRGGINAGVACARGEFVMKLDGHCALDQGYDIKLAADCEPNWVVVPRRYRLDADRWAVKRGTSPIDYQYLSYPDNPNDRGGPGLHGRNWPERDRDAALRKVPVDDLMSAQGSCYFMARDYFHRLELLDEANYGPFGSEFQEVGLKAWLSGGRVVRNKATWYAHLHKGRKYGRGYRLSRHAADKAVQYANRWMTDDAWDGQTRPFRWLIEHFWPVPGWPKEWAP